MYSTEKSIFFYLDWIYSVKSIPNVWLQKILISYSTHTWMVVGNSAGDGGSQKPKFLKECGKLIDISGGVGGWNRPLQGDRYCRQEPHNITSNY